jgi:hypothetical protein
MTSSSESKALPHVALRAALYLRVSTARQAEHDVSIPDQKRQGEAYCEARGLQLVERCYQSNGVRPAVDECLLVLPLFFGKIFTNPGTSRTSSQD